VLEGEGHVVGPDLAALTDRSAEGLLVEILDPNRAVEDKFLDYVAVTTDGRQFTGIIAAETGNSITLAGQEGKRQVILRGELDEIRSSGKSLMPEGVEKDLSVQDLADLIAYVRSTGPPPKQFDGNVPQIVRAGDDGVVRLAAANARIYGPEIVFEQHYKNLGYWHTDQDYAAWTFVAPRAGRYRVALDYAVAEFAAGNTFVLKSAGQSLTGTVESTGTWDNYVTREIGTIELPEGATELIFRPAGPVNGALIDLRTLTLTPE
jgi:putative heme-binding domain-containing protein